MTRPHPKPPFWARWLLKQMEAYNAANEAAGDFEENFQRLAKSQGRRAASRWYAAQVLASFPQYGFHLVKWRLHMLRSVFKTAWRILKKEKLFAGINLFGLATGLSASLLIFLWVQYELSYDRHHVHADHLFRVISVKDAGQEVPVPVTAPALAPALASGFSDVAAACRLRNMPQPIFLSRRQETAFQLNTLFTEPSWFDCFTAHFLYGDAMDWLGKETVILSASTAQRLFGRENAVNEQVVLDGRLLRVVGILQDAPGPSHLNTDIMIPLSLLEEMNARLDLTSWRSLMLFTYVRLQPSASADDFQTQIQRLMQENQSSSVALRLQPLRDIHLYALEGPDPVQTLRLYALLAIFILTVASINFVNLATARSTRRVMEVGMRKTLGARRQELVLQFMGEAALQVLTAFVLALLLSALLMPEFQNLTGRDLELAHLIQNGRWILLAALPLILILITGFYPAWSLSSHRPRQAMETGGQRRSCGLAQGRGRIRQGLVILQFTLSLILFIGALGITRQLRYLQNKPLGFTAENLIFTDIQPMSADAFNALRNDLTAHTAIESATRSNATLLLLGFETNSTAWEGQSPGQKLNVQIRCADADYLNTMKMTLKSGRFFEADRQEDQGSTCLVNEAALRHMGLTDPVGKWFRLGDTEMRIIGVVKDFHHHSMHMAIEPVLFVNMPQWTRVLFLRINGQNRDAAVAHIQSLWPRIMPGKPMQIHGFSQELDALYQNEHHTASLVWYLGALSILVAGLGLLGLVTYTVESARKEMGIRKVLGASSWGIARQWVAQYLRWNLTAIIIASPVSWWMLSRWLAGFAYRITPGGELFLLGGVVIMSLTTAVVGSLSFKAAQTPPVKTLRYE